MRHPAPPFRLDFGQIEVVDDQTVAALRGHTGAQRLAAASDMFDSARAMLTAHLRNLHPEWSAARVNTEVMRRMCGEAYNTLVAAGRLP